MGKKFQDNAMWVLKSVYYMKDPKKITREIEKGRMSLKELATVSLYLVKKGLLIVKETEKGAPFRYNLTDKGVEYVVKELDRKNQTEFNRVIALTGVILALTGIYKFIKDILSGNPAWWVQSIFIILIFIAIIPLISFIITPLFKSYFKEE